MWAAIKKAINSNLAKPLNVLLGELYNSHKTDIGNTYNKAYEANDNALKSLQKGQEIVNMLNDTGGKRYTVNRSGNLNGYERFDYSGGAGILRFLRFEYSGNDPQIIIDGVYISNTINSFLYVKSRDEQIQGNMELIEFRNSITILCEGARSLRFLVQTER